MCIRDSVLTGLANAYIPRTYTCSTVLMSMGNAVLETQPGYYNSSLVGASGQILSRDNLENIVRDTHLVETAAQRRPPLLRLKDKLSSSSGVSEKDKISAMVLTLESKLLVSTQGNLEIDADWSDGQTAADIADSARESFLKIRHSAEVSAFEEKVTILDEHAIKLRAEIEQLAAQINTANERSNAQPQAVAAPGVTTPTTTRTTTKLRSTGAAPRAAEPDAELPVLREQLAADKTKLATLEQEHDRQVRDEQAKLDDLKLKFTPAHPQVVTQQERVALVTAIPSDIALLRQEVADGANKIKAREALSAHLAGEPVAVSGIAANTTESLTPAVVQALQTGEADQALAQQLTGAVARYGLLQDEIGSGRIALDTAQAAFNHRYQVIVPVEVPRQPRKPKATVIWGAGLAATLLLVLLLPIVAELRRGILIERWQVEQLHLPILAELHLPTDTGDSDNS